MSLEELFNTQEKSIIILVEEKKLVNLDKSIFGFQEKLKPLGKFGPYRSEKLPMQTFYTRLLSDKLIEKTQLTVSKTTEFDHQIEWWKLSIFSSTTFHVSVARNEVQSPKVVVLLTSSKKVSLNLVEVTAAGGFGIVECWFSGKVKPICSLRRFRLIRGPM